MPPTVGKLSPEFSLSAHDGSIISLAQLRGSPVVLYFYPKDNTPSCTSQACAFRDEFPRFDSSGVTILGVSPDSVESHARFRKKFDLPFTLLSDPDHAVANLYDVWEEKKLFGLKYMGVARTTFIIDGAGVLRHHIPVRRVSGHAEHVLELLQQLR